MATPYIIWLACLLVSAITACGAACAQSGEQGGRTTIEKTSRGSEGADAGQASSAAPQPVAPGGWSTEISSPPAVAASVSTVRAVDVVVDDKHTWVILAMSSAAEPDILVYENPYRLILQLSKAELHIPAATNLSGRGLVTDYRFGRSEGGKVRIVASTSGPVRAERSAVEKQMGSDGDYYRIGVRLTSIDATQFRPSPLENLSSQNAAESEPATPTGKPVVVIDPGHGGVDSGASGATLQEKDVVLAVGRKLHESLLASGHYDVRLTRDTDIFLPLDRRVAISQQAGASLFISLHADSISKEIARNVRGATIYTLSGRASDDLARRLAEKENAADAAGGLPVIQEVEDGRVKGILLDLMSRESLSLAGKFSGLLVGQMQRGVTLARDPLRSAAFKVLQQPQSPAVLIELGYVSNDRDESLLASPEWQSKMATAIASAVHQYFAK